MSWKDFEKKERKMFVITTVVLVIFIFVLYNLK